MKRRTILKRAAAAGIATGLASSTAAAYHEGDCHGLEDSDCVLDDCSDYCPNKCCACACVDGAHRRLSS
jgi:hypothetical protein